VQRGTGDQEALRPRLRAQTGKALLLPEVQRYAEQRLGRQASPQTNGDFEDLFHLLGPLAPAEHVVGGWVKSIVRRSPSFSRKGSRLAWTVKTAGAGVPRPAGECPQES
jgi:hypothetical protein